jgi:hypothetical protein
VIFLAQHSLSFFQRSGKINNHHIIPKSRGGKRVEENLLRIDTGRHAAWHLLFGDLTLKEAAAVLLRVAKMKESSSKRSKQNSKEKKKKGEIKDR